MKDNKETANEILRASIIEIAVQAWRMKSIVIKIYSKLDLIEQKKLSTQFSWFTKKIEEALLNVGLRTVNLEGQIYDMGMAVKPINMDEFNNVEDLEIEQMLEPIIMEQDSVVKTGSVILRRRNL